MTFFKKKLYEMFSGYKIDTLKPQFLVHQLPVFFPLIPHPPHKSYDL